MLLQNIRVTISEITDTDVVFHTEQGQSITVPAQLLPDAKKGTLLYLAIDDKPLVSSEKHAKDVLNEMIKN